MGANDLAKVKFASQADPKVLEGFKELARKEGQSRLAAWKAKPGDMTALVTVVSREQAQSLSPAVLNASLQADPAALPVVLGVDLGAQGYAVVKVNRILSRTAPDDAAAKQGRSQYAQLWATAENQAYYGVLKERYKVKINVAQAPAATSK